MALCRLSGVSLGLYLALPPALVAGAGGCTCGSRSERVAGSAMSFASISEAGAYLEGQWQGVGADGPTGNLTEGMHEVTRNTTLTFTSGQTMRVVVGGSKSSARDRPIGLAEADRHRIRVLLKDSRTQGQAWIEAVDGNTMTMHTEGQEIVSTFRRKEPR